MISQTPCGDDYARSVKNIRHLMERPACVRAAIEIKRLAYYWNVSGEYRKAFDDAKYVNKGLPFID